MLQDINAEETGIGVYVQVFQPGEGLQAVRIRTVVVCAERHAQSLGILLRIYPHSHFTEGSKTCKVPERLGPHGVPEDMTLDEMFEDRYSIRDGVRRRL